jgi:plastocyanin
VRSLLAPAVLVLLVAGCGGEDEGAEDAPRSVRVNIASFKFTPDPVELTTEGTITFVNRDRAPHNAESPDAGFNTVRQETGDAKKITLTEPGTYEYFCRFHRFMTGTIDVAE